jgi:putative hydrolase of the HAD superfamily
VVSAVLWDFGGVILTSPFEAFAHYEREQGLPAGFIRRVNATNPLDNAWARLERGELDRAGFAEQFGAEARALGGTLSGDRVLELLAGDIRPEMVTALERCREAELRTACLTNNIGGGDDGSAERAADVARIMLQSDVVVESSVVGVRKPEREFYEIACRLLRSSRRLRLPRRPRREPQAGPGDGDDHHQGRGAGCRAGRAGTGARARPDLSRPA